MQLRKATPADLPAIMMIIQEAKAYLKDQGLNQWQDGYPDEETIAGDLAAGTAYVLDEAGEVLGTVALTYAPDPTYLKISDGRWLSSGDYRVIHRMALASRCRGKGYSEKMMALIEAYVWETGVRAIRVDTHEHNLVMQGNLRKNGYFYCGVIYLVNGHVRLAYEKMLAPRKLDEEVYALEESV